MLKVFSMYISALGNSLDILRELEQGIQMKTVRSNPIIDMSYCVPTPTGLPLYLNMTWNTVFVLDASARVENVPSVRDLMSAIMPSGSRSSSRYATFSASFQVVHCKPIASHCG